MKKLEFAHNVTLKSVPTDVGGLPTEQTVSSQVGGDVCDLADGDITENVGVGPMESRAGVIGGCCWDAAVQEANLLLVGLWVEMKCSTPATSWEDLRGMLRASRDCISINLLHRQESSG